MSYDFKNLSSADFEDLVRDLIGKEENVRFEAFCAGPDGGMDGRHSKAAGDIILQAKHYEGSPSSKLNSAMKGERKSIDTLAPARYILATSCKLTPANKSKLAALAGPCLKSQSDIFGPDDLNYLLRKYPEILKAHIKLWLSGAAVLDRVVRSAAHTYAAFTQEEIERKVRVYAPNPSFEQSLDKLEKHHLLIVSGPPGVGKSTLAEMLCYTFLSEAWELVPIRSLEDGFAAITDSKKQIFLFDDFLGRVALDRQALAHKDSELARFMNRVRRSPNARFILTTRGYIFEEARRVSEHLGDGRLDVTKYVLDVGVYTRRIKARILYNHLLVSATPQTYIRALIDSGKIAAIVDHRNYNPRVIEAMTGLLLIGDIEPPAYPDAFLNALKNPSQIWDAAFRTHIDDRCRHLLIAMFFSSEYGAPLAELRTACDSVHSFMCAAYGLPHGPKDFEEAVRILEGSFVSIADQRVSFVNPSLKDYLSSYLLDRDLLLQLASTAKTIDWLQRLWEFVYPKGLGRAAQINIAHACIPHLDMIEKRPHWRPVPGSPNSLEYNDTNNAARINTLLDWWNITDDLRFADSVINIARNPQQGFTAWFDGDALVSFLSRLRGNEYGRPFVYESAFLPLIEGALDDMIRWGGSDSLASLVDAIHAHLNDLPASIIDALKAAILDEFENNTDRIENEESESSLNERIDDLKKFAPIYGIPDMTLKSAISQIEDRIGEIEERSAAAEQPSFSPSKSRDTDKFDDSALQDLFSPLLYG